MLTAYVTFELPGEAREGLVQLLRHQTTPWTWSWRTVLAFSKYRNIPMCQNSHAM